MNCRKIVFVMCAGKKFKMFLKRKLKLEHGCSISHNVLRFCVCLPLAQSFKLPQMLMGQIAQNRCYNQ
jgi:hypothetical protein